MFNYVSLLKGGNYVVCPPFFRVGLGQPRFVSTTPPPAPSFLVGYTLFASRSSFCAFSVLFPPPFLQASPDFMFLLLVFSFERISPFFSFRCRPLGLGTLFLVPRFSPPPRVCFSSRLTVHRVILLQVLWFIPLARLPLSPLFIPLVPLPFRH